MEVLGLLLIGLIPSIYYYWISKPYCQLNNANFQKKITLLKQEKAEIRDAIATLISKHPRLSDFWDKAYTKDKAVLSYIQKDVIIMVPRFTGLELVYTFDNIDWVTRDYVFLQMFNESMQLVGQLDIHTSMGAFITFKLTIGTSIYESGALVPVPEVDFKMRFFQNNLQFCDKEYKDVQFWPHVNFLQIKTVDLPQSIIWFSV